METHEISGASILVVDDTPDLLALLAEILSTGGYAVRSAASGAQALADAQREPPDLILLDLMMPEMDGYQLCAKLKADERTRHVPVIVISALEKEEEKLKAFSLGVVDYIPKPFMPLEVLARVRMHLTLVAMRRQLEEKNAQLEREVAALTRAEEIIRRQLAYLQMGVDALAFPFYVVDAADYCVRVANQDAGGEAPEGQTCHALIFGSDQHCEQIECPVDTVKAERAAVVMEHVREDDGKQKHLEIHGGPIFDDAGQVALAIVYVLDITDRVMAEASRRVAAEAKLLAEERRRISQETHDGVVQSLAGLRFQVRQWHKLVESDPEQMHAELDGLRDVLSEALRDMRRSIFALRPLDLEEQGFFAALHKYLTGFEAHYQVRVKVQVNGDEARLPQPLELTLFRAIQETLSNVGKHAQARTVWLSFDLEAGAPLSVTIRDDGRGFDPVDLPGLLHQGHLGLHQMRERLEQAGGQLTTRSQPGSGTEVRLSFPY